MSVKILCVDDEPNILKAYQRVLSGTFLIETATSGQDGLARLSHDDPFAVVVSDMRMPGMDGIEFLRKMKEVAPDTVRMMLTGNADQQTAIDAVNTGNIFRFLTKPCSPEDLGQAISAGIEQYRLVMAERELLEKTLKGCVKTLTDILSLINPIAFSRASRLRRLAREIAIKLHVESVWQIEMAAMLSQVGCITVPETTLAKAYQGGTITGDELQMVRAHPQVGRDLLAHIPRLEEVAEMIVYQEKLFNGAGPPRDGKRGDEIPLGGRILKVAIDFDGLTQRKCTHYEAYERIRQKSGDWYDASVVEALSKTFSTEISEQVRSVRVTDLVENMILAEDLLSVSGVLLVAKGQETSASLRIRLENYVKKGFVLEPIRVLVS
jgi:response regulator RpfG family c-di-GMP phosphodiesterase